MYAFIVVAILNIALALTYCILLIKNDKAHRYIMPIPAALLAWQTLNYSWYRWTRQQICVFTALVFFFIGDILSLWPIFKEITYALSYIFIALSIPIKLPDRILSAMCFLVLSVSCSISVMVINAILGESQDKLIQVFMGFYLITIACATSAAMYRYYIEEQGKLLWAGVILVFFSDIARLSNIYSDVGLNVSNICFYWIGITFISWQIVLDAGL